MSGEKEEDEDDVLHPQLENGRGNGGSPIGPVVMNEKLTVSSSSTSERETSYGNCNNNKSLRVQILLSRPQYRIGSSKPVVGTILVTHQQSQSTDSSQSSQSIHIRTVIESLQVSIVGLCRYDPRWFNSTTIEMERKRTASTVNLPIGFVLPPHTIPFWTATEPIELLHVTERTFGKWDDVNPMKPIQLPFTTPPSAAKSNTNDQVEASMTDERTRNHSQMEEKDQLAYTFRISIPKHNENSIATTTSEGNTALQQQFNMPHSFAGVSCRYYYVIVVRYVLKSTSNPVIVEWVQCPIVILPPLHIDETNGCSESLASFSKIHVMAHCNGLPTRLSAIELNQYEGQYTVNRNGPALYHDQQSSSINGQRMAIVDPTTQLPVGALTLLGTPNNLHPGSRLTLSIDFPMPSQSSNHITTPTNNAKASIPCYQVSACLQGEEIVMTNVSSRKRTTARRYIWDTAHECIDPDTTECVALDLLVPETIPYCIQTRNVERNVQCIIDITIGTTTTNSSSSATRKIKYRNLHLEIPCHIRPTIQEWEHPNDDNTDDTSSLQAFEQTARKLYNSAKQLRDEQQRQIEMDDTTTSTTLPNPENDVLDRIEFDTSDIQADLKILSLQMAKICGLKPKPVGWE
jgi:hypothetical protein